MNLSKQAVKAIFELSDRAEKLSRGSAGDRAEASVLVNRINSIKETGVCPDEARAIRAEALAEELNPKNKKNDREHRAKFDSYLSGGIGYREYRDFLAGTQSITYTQGIGGGFTIPIEYDDTVRESMAETDPVLDDDVVDFSMVGGGETLQPSRISGYDLSTVSAQIVAEAQQFGQQVNPTALGKPLRSDITFRANFAGSYEAEIDIPDLGGKIVRAVSVALARKIGRSVLAGRGGTDISGIQNLLPVSVNNGTAGKIVNSDLTSIYFAVDHFYRKQKKCGWLMSDAAYRKVREAADNQARPLLQFESDKEEIFGKPVYIAPSLGNGVFFSLGVGVILFGDLSHIVVRASRPTLKRTVENALVDVTKGEALYVGRMRADATLFDPSGGTNPPVVMALIS